MTDAERQQMKMKEFMSLLPLTLEIAGLPKAEAGRLFTDGQLEVRCTMVKNAYKLARQVVIDVSKPSGE
jgi:hypothetical protein